MNKEILIEEGFRKYSPSSIDRYDALYQKRIEDDYGIKYFINCREFYIEGKMHAFDFDADFNTYYYDNFKVELPGWFNLNREDKSIKDVYDFFSLVFIKLDCIHEDPNDV